MRLIHCPHPHCIKWVWIIVVITCLLFQVLPLLMMDRVMIPSSNVNETYHTVVVPQPSRSESINTASTTPRDVTAQYHPHRSKRTTSSSSSSPSSPSSASPKRHTPQPPARHTSRSNNIIPMNSHKNNDTSTRTRPNILMIHIGKTGGETLKQILSIGCQSMKNRRRKQSCYRNLPRNNRTHIGRSSYSALSIHTQGYYHCDKMIVAPHIQQQLQLLSIPPPTLYISNRHPHCPKKPHHHHIFIAHHSLSIRCVFIYYTTSRRSDMVVVQLCPSTTLSEQVLVLVATAAAAAAAAAE